MDIAEFLFYTVLKIDPYSSIITGEFSHDMVYVLLIPSIFLIVMLQQFGKEIFHGGKQSLLISIAGLAVIIVSGWYGAIASFSAFLFPVLLGFFIIKFLYRMVISQKTSNAGIKAAAWGSKKVQQKYGNVFAAPMGGREKRRLVSMMDEACNIHEQLIHAEDAYRNLQGQGGNAMGAAVQAQALAAALQQVNNLRGLFGEKINEIKDFAEDHRGGKDAIKDHLSRNDWATGNDDNQQAVNTHLFAWANTP